MSIGGRPPPPPPGRGSSADLTDDIASVLARAIMRRRTQSRFDCLDSSVREEEDESADANCEVWSTSP